MPSVALCTRFNADPRHHRRDFPFREGRAGSRVRPRRQPPITLIVGDRLIDLLIEHGIGVRTRSIRRTDLRSRRIIPP